MTENKNIDLSVALPVYNGANYLGKALDSILAQDFADFELIVSDNCSSDATPEILAKYAERDVRLKVFRCAALLPQAENVNRAIGLCSGTWVKLFCHDDIMHPRCLSAIHKAIEASGHERLGLVGNAEAHLFSNGYLYNSPDQKRTEGPTFVGRNFISAVLAGTGSVCLPSLTTATVRREAWKSNGGFDGRFAHFDVFYWMRLLMEWDYLFLSERLTTNRIHTAQVAVSARKTLKSAVEHRIFYKEFVDQFGEDLRLNRKARIKVRLKHFSTIGSMVAIELIKGKVASALRLLSDVPPHWFALLPVFVMRSFYLEKKRLMPIKNHVPLTLIYPD